MSASTEAAAGIVYVQTPCAGHGRRNRLPTGSNKGVDFLVRD
jgi:hypothetical protein